MANELEDQARLAKAEEESEGGVMVSKIEHGRFVIRKESPEELARIAEELGLRRTMSTAELETRTEALTEVIRDKTRWERDQIVAVVAGYSEDCMERSQNLATDPKRAAAFKIRSAIAADIARKIESGWGRDPGFGLAQ